MRQAGKLASHAIRSWSLNKASVESVREHGVLQPGYWVGKRPVDRRRAVAGHTQRSLVLEVVVWMRRILG